MSDKYYRYMNRVAVLQWPGTTDCYVCVSGSKKPKVSLYGPKWHGDKCATESYESEFRSKPRVTFCVHAGNAFAEWDGDYGPITVWLDASTGIPEGYNEEDVAPHWFFEKAVGRGNWSQLAVDRNELPRCLVDGCYDLIFSALRRFAESHSNSGAGE